MISLLSLSWLPRLAGVIRRWTGRAWWERHHGRWAGGAAFVLWRPPLPAAAAPGPFPERDAVVRAQVERLHATLLTGVTVAPPLLSAVRLGAVIHARLDTGVTDAPPALLSVQPADAPCPTCAVRLASPRGGRLGSAMGRVGTRGHVVRGGSSGRLVGSAPWPP